MHNGEKRSRPFPLRAGSLVAIAFGVGLGIAAGIVCAGCGDSSDGSPGEPADASVDRSVGFDAAGDSPNAADSSSDARDAAVADAFAFDTGTPTTLDGGIPCIVGGFVEQEPNDTELTANTLSGTLCGTITVLQPSDAGTDASSDASTDAAGDAQAAQDLDVMKFRLQTSTTTFFLYFEGNVSLTVRVNGQTVVMTPNSSPAIPYFQGQDYIVEVRSIGGQQQNWRVSLYER